MSLASLSFETLHASTVAIDGRAVLIGGRSGAGKSDLSLRLIDRGARLVADDYTHVRRVDGRLIASAPATISGRIEVRHVGLLDMEAAADVPVALYVDCDRLPERLPAGAETRMIAGVAVPAIALAALEASAPIKLELALARFGLAAA
jgi:serine kinase of HPr protein (carbohydrate metabolism regulator)